MTAGAAAMGRWRTRVRACALAACLLALAAGAAAQSPAPVRPAAASAPRQSAAPRDAGAEPARPAAPAVTASARQWWLALLVILVGGLGVVALLARRRAARAPVPAPTYSDGWQGIGGPSYAPRPVTVRFDPRAGGSDTARSGDRRGAPPREALKRPFGVPADFDAPAFLANARQSFVRLQSAWDRSDLHELDECTTDEMFNALTHELRVRAGPSRTEVIELTASLLGIETAAGEYRASVRFSGNLKVNGEDERLDEVWNLSKPVDGSNGWLLAGIQQLN